MPHAGGARRIPSRRAGRVTARRSTCAGHQRHQASEACDGGAVPSLPQVRTATDFFRQSRTRGGNRVENLGMPGCVTTSTKKARDESRLVHIAGSTGCLKGTSAPGSQYRGFLTHVPMCRRLPVIRTASLSV